jgi:hypothetical protein
MKSRALIVAALFVVAGCGGGGSTPAGHAPSGAAPTGGQKQTASLIVTFPLGQPKPSAKLKRPKFISPLATQFEVQILSVNSGPPPGWVNTDATTPLDFTPGTGNCTTSGSPATATCTIPIAAPPGSVNYVFTAEDNAPHFLSTLNTTLTVAPNASNSFTVTLLGIVATMQISGSSLSANTVVNASPISINAPPPPPPVPAGETLTVTALDASGAQIVGPANYAYPITITDNDVTLQTTLNVNFGTQGSTAVLANPNDRLALHYTGQAINTFTLTASGNALISGGGTITATVNDITFSGTTLDGGSAADPNWSEPTVFFSQPSGTAAMSGAEVGWTNGPYSQQFDLDPGDGTNNTCGPSGIATFSASPATTFTITATATGVCKVRLKEHGTGYPISSHPAPSGPTDTTHDGTFWISISSAGLTTNGTHRR